MEISMFDQRYSSETYAYGKSPNDFLVQSKSHLPPPSPPPSTPPDDFNNRKKTKILCIGEGEGRNAVYLAKCGYDVTAVDASRVGLAKAQKLAIEENVSLTTIVADLNKYDIGHEVWGGIVSIFCHLPIDVRRKVHRDCVKGLKCGGVVVLEAYTPRQIGRGTGGPHDADLMMDVAVLKGDFEGLSFVVLDERERDVREGIYHNGLSSVVQMVARKKFIDDT